jgi:hypothetical protein
MFGCCHDVVTVDRRVWPRCGAWSVPYERTIEIAVSEAVTVREAFVRFRRVRGVPSSGDGDREERDG